MVSRLFTADDVGDSIQPLPGDLEAGWYRRPVRVDADTVGHVYVNWLAVGNVVGPDRITEWIVHALNRRVVEVKRGVVNADLLSKQGYTIPEPGSASELDGWERLS